MLRFSLQASIFSLWIIAAIVYAYLYSRFSGIELAAHRVFFQNALVGLITSTAVFFILEQVLQKTMASVFFPAGGLQKIPKTARIHIGTRLAAFIIAVNLIPFLALLLLSVGTYNTGLPATLLLEHVRSAVVTNSIIAISVGICLTVLIAFNLHRPLKNIITVLKQIHGGSLNGKVKVTTNDEIGYAGDIINEMTDGLKERERMKHSLELARQIQMNLLPRTAPLIPGLDIAGFSRYCDETGGDYYDFIAHPAMDHGKLGVVIGDVSDHGIHSALLMTTARALIRQRLSMPGDIGAAISDVNHQLAIDIKEGGQFMTLFFLRIDVTERAVHWIRAGHDPAAWYDPKSNKMEELKGPGIPLGINANHHFQVNGREGFAEGQIIILGTDGIWEAQNGSGEFFGKQRFYRLIRSNAEEDAQTIIAETMNAIERFQNGVRAEDDITMVVIKAGRI